MYSSLVLVDAIPIFKVPIVHTCQVFFDVIEHLRIACAISNFVG